MGLTLIVTNAGRAALVNAANTGTAPVTIAQVGLTGTAVTPDATATTLPGEFKRIATLSGDVVADDTIHLIVRDETGDVFTVRSLALYLADGTLFAIYGQADVLIEKSAQALMLLAIDVKFADIDATSLTFGDANFLNPPATTEQMGVVELSTLAEATGGTSTTRVPPEKMVKDAVSAWLDARFGAGNSGIWHPGNDGAGSGLDADLLDGQQGSYYTAITARLGYTPVQQGTGNGQLANTVKIGWSAAGRLKATVDAADQGNFVFDGNIADVWRSSNDGAGSGLDADLLDGQDGSYYTNIIGRLGYTPANKGGDTFTGDIGAPRIYLSANGDGQAAKIGDDAWIGDCNVSNAISIRGVQDASKGYIVFGNGDSTALGRSGTGALTYAGNVVWHAGVDGAGSGLDADLLDGQQGSAYVRNNVSTEQTIPSRVVFGAGIANTNEGGEIAFAKAPNGTSTTDPYIDIYLDKFRMVGAPGGITKVLEFPFASGVVWHTGNDGAGSGLDADLLDGQDSNYYTNIVARLGYTPLNAASYTASDVIAKMLTVDGGGSGLDADLLDGQHGSYYADIVARLGYTPVSKSGDSFTNVLSFISADNSDIASRPNSSTQLEVKGNGTGAAVMTFHRPNQHATFFGLDTDNKLKVGGWSAGAVANLIWHAGNDGSGSGLDADTLDGFHASQLLRIIAEMLGSNGYMQLSNGELLQWGRWTSSASSGFPVTVNFPVSFSAEPHTLVAMPVITDTSIAACWSSDGITGSAFPARCNRASIGCRYFAVGPV